MSLIYFDACPNWHRARERLEHAIDALGGGGIDLKLVPVATQEDALNARMSGSPTILIDGVDPYSDLDIPVGLGSRTFQTEHGPDDTPSIDELVDALRSTGGDEFDPYDATNEASFPASDPPEAGAPGL